MSEKDPQHRPQDEQETLRLWYRMAGVGIEFVVSVLLCGALGWWLDKPLHTRPWLMVAGGILGFVVGLWILMRAARDVFRG